MYDDLRETVKCFLGEKERSRKLVLVTWNLGRINRENGEEDFESELN